VLTRYCTVDFFPKSQFQNYEEIENVIEGSFKKYATVGVKLTLLRNAKNKILLHS